VVSNLLDSKKKEDFWYETQQDYEELRQEHYASLQERTYLPLEKAREKRLRVDWSLQSIVCPSFLGSKVFRDYPLDRLVDQIDWNPFFSVWQLKGNAPNRGYPKIFNDPKVGLEAKRVFDDAQNMLKEIIAKKSLQARGVLGFYAANSVGDDIEVYEDDSRQKKIATFYGLRQQAENDASEVYLSLSDFIAPKVSNVKDYIGIFVVSTGFGIEELEKRHQEQHDDYSSIMAKAIADRLAEAFAETLHEEVRKHYWGYASEESLSSAEKFKVKYAGIRPAPGYPTQPDHTEKTTIWNLLKAKEETGIELTESLAMWPAASVSGLYFASKESRYFAVGKITKEQVVDYAARKGTSVEEIERWLRPILSYE